MARGRSGRIVIDVEPELKGRLYATLALSGTTLKDWFLAQATDFCAETQLSLFNQGMRHTEGGAGGSPSEGSYRAEAPALAAAPGAAHTVISMFSGCGGMDLGFLGGFSVFDRFYSRLPFSIVWANDLNKAACATYRRNLGREILCGDVWDVIDSLPKKADVIVGGFPCQDISVNGKRAGVNGSAAAYIRP